MTVHVRQPRRVFEVFDPRRFGIPIFRNKICKMEGSYAVLFLLSVWVYKCTADFYRGMIGGPLLNTLSTHFSGSGKFVRLCVTFCDVKPSSLLICTLLEQVTWLKSVLH